MFQWVKSFRESSSETKNAIFALLFWALPVILTAIFCYARLDFVRSYETPLKSVEHTTSK